MLKMNAASAAGAALGSEGIHHSVRRDGLEDNSAHDAVQDRDRARHVVAGAPEHSGEPEVKNKPAEQRLLAASERTNGKVHIDDVVVDEERRGIQQDLADTADMITGAANCAPYTQHAVLRDAVALIEGVRKSLGGRLSSGAAKMAMSAPELRPYQIEAVEGVEAALREVRGVLLVSPTGGGKTIVFAELIRRNEAAGKRAFVLVHRRELTKQASDKLSNRGVAHGVIQAGFEPRAWLPTQVVSVPTFTRRVIQNRRLEIDAPPDLIVIDECHHVPARSYQAIIDRYPGAKLVGVTATPCRADGRGLGGVFQRMIETVDLPALQAAGYLVPVVTYAPSQPDLRGVHVRQGDYVTAEVEERVDTQKLVGDIVEHWLRLARGRPTVVFCASVRHSIHVRDRFREAGIMAEHLDGEMPAEERDILLAKLASGEIEVITNCGVLTEGWDAPAVSCIVLAKPTKSLGLFRQMVGRGLRPVPGKENLLLLDHADATRAHGLISDPIAWSLHEDRRAVNHEHSARTAGHKPGLTTCPECLAVRVQGKPCDSCGWRPRTRGESFEVIDGELARVDADGTARASAGSAAEKQLFYQELAYIARELGHKPGAAFYRYGEKFKGEKPPYHWRNLPPLPPRPETRAWYRSRQIAYAKVQQRRSA
jgi:superfamily II DNA or RNA helicase